MAQAEIAPPHFDHLFITSCVLLTGAGLITLYSASFSFAELFYNDKLYFLTRQAILAALGFFCFFIITRIRLDFIRKIIMPLVLFTMAFCMLPLVPGIGATLNGATRWIKIGPFTAQPSELVKLVLPLYLAHIFDKKKEMLDDVLHAVCPPVAITVVFFALIYFQNNFSTALFIAVNSLLIFYLAGVKLRYFICAVIILIPVSVLLIMTKEHRLLRFLSFFNPEFDPQGAGFQVNASVTTISQGGLWGRGLGQGIRKVGSVPEIQSDFVFASFAEEAGFIGVLLFLLCFFIFALRAYRIAFAAQNSFYKILVIALATGIITQTLMNIAVVSGAIPATGVPLPFFSAGGSSLLMTLISGGIIANVSKNGSASLREEEISEIQNAGAYNE
jgi:cell division protein FtsW